MTNALRVRVRWMIRRDMPYVMDIESGSFESPWSEEDFIRCLNQKNVIGMSAEYDDQIIGFVLYELSKTRIRLIRVAVDPDCRRRGIGTQIIAKLAGKLSPERRRKIELDVMESNLVGQVFFRECGFLAILTIRGLHSDEDAYRMIRSIRLPSEPGAVPVNRVSGKW